MHGQQNIKKKKNNFNNLAFTVYYNHYQNYIITFITVLTCYEGFVQNVSITVCACM